MKLFETMRLDNGEIRRFQYHTVRLGQACIRLEFSFSQRKWEEYVETIKSKYPQGVFRLKVEVDKAGQLSHVLKPLTEKNKFTAKLKESDATCSKEYVINKTTERQHLAHNHHTDLILLYSETGKILEFDIGNIMIKENGQYYTPSYEEDFLLGCMRQSLIDEHKLFIKDYNKDELIKKLQSNKVQIYLLNSLREVAEVSIYI
ncbi:aminotransferase class IV [Staphylococcus sp. NRL 16/872]|uniref:aminotransferase class IV n=1 Tax=Staphylococcus sp. NRL 16/872 TaxID=2930131 RepID=UPI001FB465EF|nr:MULTISPECIES: aminotransferase class IV [unclassified Staphylococcus]MCJ1656937.1 aminotransferase class IV [Staphylococcus sp. NRL 21/187]MCJ1662683.1 aminotransferase class IV [Staphylococcus sp. NRL 18/288]MCJ1668788.1 aminotransferase class IV [Staphylococcus sp. NRL 19/737]WEN69005.1 aminotransferase class IV [Staphylococcus sp. NRL 16/872]